MINDKSTIVETMESLVDTMAEIERAFGDFKKIATAPEVKAFFHRAQHIFQETSRTLRDLLITASPSLLQAINAIAPIPS
jgi:hypothetical protein